MNSIPYREALTRLGLKPHSNATRQALGISPRMLTYLASGKREPSRTLALLISSYLSHGLPDGSARCPTCDGTGRVPTEPAEFSPTCATRRGER